MKSKKWIFPHPLLAAERDDYVGSTFTLTEGKHETQHDSFEFCFVCNLDCPGLEGFIKEGKARPVLHITSSSAKYRKDSAFSLDDEAVKVVIKKNDLVKRVSFSAVIMATEDTVLPLLPEHNPDAYDQSQKFKLRAGDILAESETIKISLDDTELLKPLSSIFQIALDANPTKGISYRPEFADKILILLDDETYKRYDRLKRGYPIRRNLSAVITMPALTEAICMMKGGDVEEFKERRWYRSLENKLIEAGIDLADCDDYCSSVANRIYGEIVFDALSTVEDAINELSAESDGQEIGGID